MYHPDDCLMISGLQHFRFCRRQWALIHIEQQWAENVRTVEGNFLHERAHNEQLRESRGDLLIVRGLRVQSLTLGLTGQCDVVEFRRDDAHGVPLAGKHGLWLPYPVEYKRARRSRIAATNCSCARRLCVWRRCSAARCRMARSFTASRAAVWLCRLRRSCARKSARAPHRCMTCTAADIRRA